MASWWWYILSQHQIVTICNRHFYPQKLFLVVVAETTWHHSPLKVQNKISNRAFFRKPFRKIPTVVCSNENLSGYILLWGFKLCACCACLQTSCLACEYQLQTCKRCSDWWIRKFSLPEVAMLVCKTFTDFGFVEENSTTAHSLFAPAF